MPSIGPSAHSAEVETGSVRGWAARRWSRTASDRSTIGCGSRGRSATGRWLAAVLILALAGPRAGAIETDDPTRLSRAIFALYGRNGAGLDLNGPAAGEVLAPSLLALVAADRKAADGEAGALDFDSICGCQDFDITAVKATARRRDAENAEVSVAFRNFGKPQTIRFSLIRTPLGWRIADIHSRDVPGLVAYLRRAAR